MSAPPKKCEEGAPTWIVTFADLMSLLLTFFVLLLSFSVMETDKFKKIAGAMSDAFGMQSFDRMSGIIELEGSIAGSTSKHVVPIPIPEIESLQPEDENAEETEDDVEPVQEVPDNAAEKAKRTFNDIQTVMANEIASDVMAIIRAGNVTVVRFPDKVSFPSGSGEFKDEFVPILSKFLSVLNKSEGNILISGHTDDIPISTDQFRSNWDLSANRAGSVAHYILKNTDIDASRITVQGFADSRPLAPNDSPENRSKNRRVEITIQSVSGENANVDTDGGDAGGNGEAQPSSDGIPEALDTQAGADLGPIYGPGGNATAKPPSIITSE